MHIFFNIYIFVFCRFSSPDVAINPDFRLWLSSKAYGFFPINILQKGMKVRTNWQDLSVDGCALLDGEVLAGLELLRVNDPPSQLPEYRHAPLHLTMWHSLFLFLSDILRFVNSGKF